MKNKGVRVVRVRGRRWTVLWAAVAGLIVLGLSAAAYFFGLYQHGRISDETERLQQQIATLQAERDELEKAVIDARVAASVDQATADELRRNLAEIHEEQAELSEEVTFYRSLMAPTSLERGLQISEFALLALDGAGQFRYELLLTQVEARRSVVSGSVTVDVVGERDGEQVVLPLTEMEPETDYPLKYRFRYFQDFSGELQLPAGFEPLRIVVTVTRKGSREANLQRTFDWQIEVG